jgi:RNA polymerase primary sigma factor
MIPNANSETPVAADSAVTRADLLGDDAAADAPRAAAEAGDLSNRLLDAVDQLSPRERRVLHMRFGLDGEPDRTLDEVAAELSVSRERVRQVEAGALAKLRVMPRVRRDLAEYVR